MSRAPASPARIATLIAIPAALIAGGITAVTLASTGDDPAPSSPALGPVAGVTIAVDPATTEACTDLVAELPQQLNFGGARQVTGRADAVAWGEPPVVLVCGVVRPADLQPTSQLSQVNGVAWYVKTAIDTSAYGVPGENTLWTSVERSAYVAVVIAGTQDAASAISPVSKVIDAVLPQA